ncbi:TRAP transporter substrate-binding protein DctP [Nocardioides houyundeii]|uniref:TRAP transporter substrate-binding protein DctP n=1 Tax=Nocardioides houyundeii TaxID=2045452 RepID=UPI0013B467C4|nr:TRAP transporter substrate-binding protein DctP [Nocardioides houyundeii]
MTSGPRRPRSTSSRTRRRAGVLTASLASLALLGACAGGGSSDTAKDSTTLKFQDIYAPGNAFADASQAYGDAVTKATDGEVDFEFFWSNSVAPTNELASAMNDGLLDMGRVQPPTSPADFPVVNWLSSASFLNSSAFPAGLLQKIGAHLEFAVDSGALDADLDKQGIRYVAPLALVQQYDLLCKDPVEDLSDFKGLKIRIAGQAWAEAVEELGGTPVTLLPEEIYEGYQRGVVDCVMTYPSHYVLSGLWELGGHYVPLQFNGWNQDGVTISNTAWDSLDEDQQQEMYGGVRAWIKSFVEDQLEQFWTFATQAGEHGVKFDSVDAGVQQEIDQFHDKVLTDMVDTAPDSVEDPAGLLEEYEAAHDKWLGIVEDLGFDTDYTDLQGFVDSLDDPSKAPEIDLDPWLDRVMAEAFDLEKS